MCGEVALGRGHGSVVRQTIEWMNLLRLPITDGEIRNAYGVLVKHLRRRDNLEDGRAWNETTELHLDVKGTRLLKGLIWYWTESSALLNKITKYTNLMKQSPFFISEFFSYSRNSPYFTRHEC